MILFILFSHSNRFNAKHKLLIWDDKLVFCYLTLYHCEWELKLSSALLANKWCFSLDSGMHNDKILDKKFPSFSLTEVSAIRFNLIFHQAFHKNRFSLTKRFHACKWKAWTQHIYNSWLSRDVQCGWAYEVFNWIRYAWGNIKFWILISFRKVNCTLCYKAFNSKFKTILRSSGIYCTIARIFSVFFCSWLYNLKKISNRKKILL